MDWDKKTIVFDLDGTLIDTAPDLHAALNHAFAADGMETVSLKDVRSTIGHGAKAMIERNAELLSLLLTDADITRLHRAFLDYYIAHIADLSEPFDGILETLDRLKAKGAKLAVCTNKTQSLAEQALREIGLAPYFGNAILGADKASQKKPAAAHLFETIALAEGSPDAAILIGDSSTDAGSAKAANIPFIFMTYGYPDNPLSEDDCIAKLPTAHTLYETIEAVFEAEKTKS